ncbi:PTS sugar transporter subunit IIA [Vagococcus elongatus]|uniref:PTS EIIA type-2 domain-containing protein n=1 Tax=Vagococcus elongatus TaxID=180344 RepID=A0A430AHZ2_9ENTE|nr:fructose PTS transporter subunit IIA [Vagococcus elongatus]RSU07614.1 hypothetical protein CBF29_13410 [Vagococcus elongatus]
MEIITEDLIYLDIELVSKEEIIDCLADILIKQNRITDKYQLIADIYHREEEASTSMGLGIAIPHTQSNSVLEASVVLIRLKRKIEWNEDKDVQIIFGIFVPVENIDNQHLKILSKLARQLTNQGFREQLLRVQTPEECRRQLEGLNQR